MATIKGEAGAVVDLTAAALHSLANASLAVLAEYDNGTNLYLEGDFELFLDTSVAPTANNGCDLYLLVAINGTNYTDTNGPPPNLYVGSFVVQATVDLRYAIRAVKLPLCKFKPYFRNNCGQTTSASGSTFKMLPTRYQSA